jgi:hypothetical protein
MKNIALLFLAVYASAQPRVFIGDRITYHESGFVSAANGTAVGSVQGSTRGNTEQVKTLNKACPAVTIVNSPETADFVISWESKTYQETPWGSHQQEFAVYKASGELLGSGGTHKIGNAGKEICRILTPKKTD